MALQQLSMLWGMQKGTWKIFWSDVFSSYLCSHRYRVNYGSSLTCRRHHILAWVCWPHPWVGHQHCIQGHSGFTRYFGRLCHSLAAFFNASKDLTVYLKPFMITRITGGRKICHY
jgi:hypothetical protein